MKSFAAEPRSLPAELLMTARAHRSDGEPDWVPQWNCRWGAVGICTSTTHLSQRVLQTTRLHQNIYSVSRLWSPKPGDISAGILSQMNLVKSKGLESRPPLAYWKHRMVEKYAQGKQLSEEQTGSAGPWVSKKKTDGISGLSLSLCSSWGTLTKSLKLLEPLFPKL